MKVLIRFTFIYLLLTSISFCQHQKTYDGRTVIQDGLFTFHIDKVSFSKQYAGETADGLFMIINIAFSHKKGTNCISDYIVRSIRSGNGLRPSDSYSGEDCYLVALKIFDSEGNEFNKWANYDMQQMKEYKFPTELKPKIKYHKTIVFEVPSSTDRYTLQYCDYKGEYINIKIRR